MAQSPLITVMTQAALKAAKGLQRDFGEVDKLQVSRKGTTSFVTASDVRAEKTIQQELIRTRPGFGFLMEEGGEVAGTEAGTRWIIDPLDGTSNFIHAVPYIAISIALEKLVNGKPEIVAGVVYDPLQNELFTAEKGQGAFVNDRRIFVSKREDMEESMLASGAPRQGKKGIASVSDMLGAVSETGASVRFFGAAALELAYLAAGRFDGYWHANLQSWDMAAGVLMVREAGGVVTDLEGGDDMLGKGHIIAGNKAIYPQLAKLLLPVHQKAAS